MGSLNKAQIIGNLGRDMELRYTQGGTPVGTFSVATTETWNDKATGEKREKTEWHRVTLWGKAAESLADYLVKGKQVYVEGRLETRKWQDRDGNDKYTTEIKADRVTLLGSSGGGGGGGRRRANEEEHGGQAEQGYGGHGSDTDLEPDAPEQPTTPLTNDDIPF